MRVLAPNVMFPATFRLDTDTMGGASNAGNITFGANTRMAPIGTSSQLVLDAAVDGGGRPGEVRYGLLDSGVGVTVFGTQVFPPQLLAQAQTTVAFDPLRALLDQFPRGADESEEDYRRRLARMLQGQNGTSAAALNGPRTCTASAPNSLSCE